jgi:hypothetical protein
VLERLRLAMEVVDGARADLRVAVEVVERLTESHQLVLSQS